LISGPTNIKIEDEIKVIKVETAEQMFKETQKNLPVDVAIFSAAVADFKVLKKSNVKIKKTEQLTIKLEKNVDILNYVSNHNSMRPRLVVGFAAETNNLEKNAIKKLKDKNCDMIIANDVSNQKIGFNSNFNEVIIFYKNDKQERLYSKNKTLISEEIVERVNNQLN
jgi:phosphopantothenoylcysteine decarboxylase/phosphopantothenate--cysteine ligase